MLAETWFPGQADKQGKKGNMYVRSWRLSNYIKRVLEGAGICALQLTCELNRSNEAAEEEASNLNMPKRI